MQRACQKLCILEEIRSYSVDGAVRARGRNRNLSNEGKVFPDLWYYFARWVQRAKMSFTSPMAPHFFQDSGSCFECWKKDGNVTLAQIVSRKVISRKIEHPSRGRTNNVHPLLSLVAYSDDDYSWACWLRSGITSPLLCHCALSSLCEWIRNEQSNGASELWRWEAFWHFCERTSTTDHHMTSHSPRENISVIGWRSGGQQKDKRRSMMNLMMHCS